MRPEIAPDCTPNDILQDCGFEFFRPIKQANFDAARLGLVYHYAVFAHQQKSYDNVYQTRSGFAEQPGNDFMVTLGGWNTLCVKSSISGWPLNTQRAQKDDVRITMADADGVQRAYYIIAGHNGVCETTAAPGDIEVVPVGFRPPG